MFLYPFSLAFLYEMGGRVSAFCPRCENSSVGDTSLRKIEQYTSGKGTVLQKILDRLDLASVHTKHCAGHELGTRRN
jgi:hypothetical protein